MNFPIQQTTKRKTRIATMAWLILSLWLTPGLAVGQSEDATDEDFVAEGTGARLISGEIQHYPVRASNDGVEGWVRASYVINKKGETEDIRILDSSIEGYFERSAIETIEQSRYEPAMWAGNPAIQANNTMTLVYYIEDTRGVVSKSFKSRTNMANRALRNGDIQEAGEIIAKLDERKQIRLSEYYYLEFLKGLYHQESGDLKASLNHFENALVVFDYTDVDEAERLDLLREVIRLNILQGNYAKALDDYEQLAQFDPELDKSGPLSQNVMKIRKFLAGSQPYPVAGEIKSSCRECEDMPPLWAHQPSRDQFSIENVNGRISEIKFLCGYDYTSFNYEPGSTWTLKPEWGDCDLHVFGSEGTTFTLVER